MPQTIVLTGSNRGIGLALARAWHARGDEVVAVCRKASDQLRQLGVWCVEGIDVSHGKDVERLRDILGNARIDMLYHNAGIMHEENIETLDFGQIQRQFEVNTLGPLRVTQALLERIPQGGKIGLMSSCMSSIANNASGGRYGYRMSKAALNAAGKSMALDLKQRGIAVAILHPGYVRTDMTGQRGMLTAAESAEVLVQRMDELDLENTGTFWHADGSVLPW